MATTKKTTAKKKIITDDLIITHYMEQVLTNHAEPKNVFQFCQHHKIEETDFYIYFGSLEALKQAIWIKFFENVKTTTESDANYTSYSNQNKLLTLYFTFFEILTLNRSYVHFALTENKHSLKKLTQLKELRNHFKDFIVDIMETQAEGEMRVNKITKPLFAEGAWVEFLIILKFWLDDTSKGFEKTDVMIEKTVKATFDVLDTSPLESLLDLGKFMWKEKFN